MKETPEYIRGFFTPMRQPSPGAFLFFDGWKETAARITTGKDWKAASQAAIFTMFCKDYNRTKTEQN